MYKMAPLYAVLWIFVISVGFNIANGNLNLFMNERETRRLLGINAELFYVRNGIINDYALSFNIPLKSEVEDLNFSWQSLRNSPPEPAMYYNMGLTVSNLQAMRQPKPNISMDGIVPTTQSDFRIRLECTGLVTAEVDIRMQLNVSIFSASNLTVLDIKRRKPCIKDSANNYKPDFINDDVAVKDPGKNVSYSVSPGKDKSGDGATGSTSIFYIAVGCACGFILLIAIIVAACYLRGHKRHRHGDRMSEASSVTGYSQHRQTFLRADTPNNCVSGMSGVSSNTLRSGYTPSIAEIKPQDVHAMAADIPLERNRITLGDILMEGTFGKIYHGFLIGEDENEKTSEQQVFIKTVTDQARQDQVEVLLREGLVMKDLFCQHINPIIGICMDNEKCPLLLYPFSNEGNMKKFLQRCKVSDITAHQVLSTRELVYMAIQIIKGVQFLHKKRIVHKDLAVRNCVVDTNLTVKVSDTALARDLFPNDYHCLGDNENRPVKWLAIEALLDRRFSPASDVWSFGVVLWELMTLGQQPYADIDPFEMSAYLKEGYRISQPMNCPDELFAVMACCWAIGPEERPKFSQLLVCLQDFYAALGKYI